MSPAKPIQFAWGRIDLSELPNHTMKTSMIIHVARVTGRSWALAVPLLFVSSTSDGSDVLNPSGYREHGTNTAEYFVAFCSRAASSSSLAGHAFIVTGKGEPLTCSIEHGDGEAYGFYPSSSGNPCEPGPFPSAKDIILNEVPGCLVNDL